MYANINQDWLIGYAYIQIITFKLQLKVSEWLMAINKEVGSGSFPGRICLSVFCFLFSVFYSKLEAQYSDSSRNNVDLFFSLKNVLSGLKKYMLYLLLEIFR